MQRHRLIRSAQASWSVFLQRDAVCQSYSELSDGQVWTHVALKRIFVFGETSWKHGNHFDQFCTLLSETDCHPEHTRTHSMMSSTSGIMLSCFLRPTPMMMPCLSRSNVSLCVGEEPCVREL